MLGQTMIPLPAVERLFDYVFTKEFDFDVKKNNCLILWFKVDPRDEYRIQGLFKRNGETVLGYGESGYSLADFDRTKFHPITKRGNRDISLAFIYQDGFISKDYTKISGMYSDENKFTGQTSKWGEREQEETVYFIPGKGFETLPK
jgi:hypothetical protein